MQKNNICITIYNILVIVTLFFVSLVINNNVYLSVLLMIYIILFQVFSKRSKLVFALSVNLLVILLLLLKIGTIKFDFIPQAKVLFDAKDDVFYWFQKGHPHAIRLLIAYPAVIIKKICGIDLNAAYGIYSVTLIVNLYYICSLAVKAYSLKNNKYQTVLLLQLFYIPFVLLAIVMNGRLISAFWGVAIMMVIFSKLYKELEVKELEILTKLPACLLLTMVSSGTMLVGLAYFGVICLYYYYGISENKRIRWHLWCLILLCTPIIMKIGQYIWFMTMRNINYFGGGIEGIINMMKHGLGRFILISPSVFSLIFCALIIFIFLNIKWVIGLIKNKKELVPMIILINISLYGSIFGYSTGLMMLPAVLVCIATVVNSVKMKVGKNVKVNVYN